MEPASRHTSRTWPAAVLRLAALGVATLLVVLATLLGGIAQNRVPSDARWTGIGAHPEFWVALASGLVAAALVASSNLLARRFGSTAERRSLAGRDRALVTAYLRARIDAWNTPDWGIEMPSAVERRMTVVTLSDREGTAPETLTEKDALDGRRMLVILGGPGAGKTWLARRYARGAAEAALALLDAGAELTEVELPVYTTWDHWARLTDAGGDGLRAGLVASSFGADVRHGGGETAGTVIALKEILNRNETRLLAVVDSLDEATGKDHAPRLGNLVGLSDNQARVVVTSRPGAWDRVRNQMPVQDGNRLVVELRDFSYPQDVEAFVGAWFEHDPERGKAVTDQLRARNDVARAAVVPLILTFYCLVAAEGTLSSPLPARRHELYDRIIAQSLARANRSVAADPDYRYPERVRQLRDWAWHAVGASNTPAGLGDWGETFVPVTPPTDEDHLALDALAPRVGVTREQTMRTFQHRTILEHLVAEHVATLSTDAAAEVLLPHLWFDPDWAVAAPAALAAHNRAHPGALLDRVLEVMNPAGPDADPAREAARRELVRVLLVAAADSEPVQWHAEHRELIGALRLDSLSWAPRLAARTAHWTGSPPGLVDSVLDQLTVTEDTYAGTALAETLAELISSESEREHAVAAVVSRLAMTEDDAMISEMARLLADQAAFDGIWHRAAVAVLDRIAASDNDLLIGLEFGALAELVPSDGKRAQLTTMVLDRIATAEDGSAVARLAAALPQLAPSDADRDRVVTAVLDRMAVTDSDYVVGALAEALPGLRPSHGHLARVLDELLDRMGAADGGVPDFSFGRIVDALPGLITTRADHERVLTVVLGLVATADTLVLDLVRALPRLIVSDRDRARAATAVFDRVSSAGRESDSFAADVLAGALPGLVASDEDRRRALLVVLNRIAALDEGWIGDMVEALPSLTTSDEDRARALTVVLDRIAVTNDRSDVNLLARALPGLISHEGDRRRVLSVLLGQLITMDRDATVDGLAEALAELEPLGDDRGPFLTAVLDRIAATHKDDVTFSLVRVLPGLVVSDVDRGLALTVVLDRIASADDVAGFVVGHLVGVLPGLIVSDADRGRALSAVVDYLGARPDNYSQHLVDAVSEIVRDLPDALHELRRVTTFAGRPLMAALVGPARSALTWSDWLSLLYTAPRSSAE